VRRDGNAEREEGFIEWHMHLSRVGGEEAAEARKRN
jgi:hypothetical protein